DLLKFKTSKLNTDVLFIDTDHDRRLELENKFIIDFKTAYPYGLNDRVKNISVTSVKDKLCICQAFFKNNSMSIPKTNRIRSKNRNNRYLNISNFIEEICNNAFKKSNFIKYVKGKVLGLSRRKATVLIKSLKTFRFNHSHVKDLIIDLLKFKTSKLNTDEDPTSFESYLVIEFSHKYIESLNIPHILRNRELVNAFPRKETYPRISYKYGPTLGSMSFNYAQFSKSLVTEDMDNYP
ncbi:MAG: hypothetical protein AAGM46_27675, partial [Cyanobacteria bacterium J06582_2]